MQPPVEARTAGQREALAGLRQEAARLFAAGVQDALRAPALDAPAPIVALRKLAWRHYEMLGFDCAAGAYEAIIPHADRLTLCAWSRAQRRYRGFDVAITVRAFWIGATVAIEFCSPDRQPLPCSETGFRSHFASFAELAEWPDLDAYLAAWFPPSEAERAGQMGLFS